ncbi:MAG: enoyl-CoA hydratase/isomerase family protein [Deltaproteobacteria bacterium]|nr:enoyl-CoA hydratase/isomerase family protein [Deltaproteobacteria bacterium]
MPDLLVERDDHVAIVTLNRPDRLNAISIPMLQAFSETLTELDTDREVRVIVITGAGRGFCSGLDMKDVAAGTGIGSDGGGGIGIGRFDLRSAPPLVLHQTDKPTLCALNGPAAGYGMDLALGCDIRIASDTAKLGAVFTKRAIVPESGGTWLLPRLVGWEKACEIVFRGKILSAQEALELGLVSRLVSADACLKETLTLAREIAANAPMAVQASKRMMRMGLNETFEANVHHVFLQLLPLMGSKDFREGVKAFLERREPEFQGR